MTEETKNEIIESKSDELSISSSPNEIVAKLDDVNSVDEFKNVANLFSLSIMKKSMSRASAQSDLLDEILDRVKDRVTNHHDEMSNKDLIDYMNAMQNGLDYSKKTMAGIDETPPITINSTHNDVRIGVDTGLDRSSRERVIDAVKKLLTDAKKNESAEESLQNAIDDVVVNIDERDEEDD